MCKVLSWHIGNVQIQYQLDAPPILANPVNSFFQKKSSETFSLHVLYYRCTGMMPVPQLLR
jgi:hypothetical protein